MRMKRTVLAAIVAAGLLAGFGCSGGGQVSPVASLPQAPANLLTAPATVSLKIPVGTTPGSSVKNPAYVSSATRSIKFSGSGIATQTLSLSPLPSAACPLQSGFYV